jgi:hypothetical protein
MKWQNNLAERLEARVLLSGTSFASISSRGTLSVVGTRRNDDIVVHSPGNQIVVSVNGVQEAFDKHSVKRLWIDAFRGDDVVSNKSSLRSTLVGAGA